MSGQAAIITRIAVAVPTPRHIAVPLRPAFLDDACIGQPLAWDLFTAAGVLVARAGTVIVDHARLASLTARPLFREATVTSEGGAVAERLRTLLAVLPDTLRLAGTANMEIGIRTHVAELADLIQLDQDLCLGLARLLPIRDPAVRHCLLTGIIVNELARQIGLPAQTQVSTVAAALTMNISAMRTHAELAKGQAPYSEDIHADMQQHPERSAKLLAAGGLTDAIWLTAVRQHHEHLDGSGYPLGLDDEAIGMPARLIRIADCYVAKITGRSYRPPKAAKQAIKDLFGSERGRLDSHLAVLLLRRMGHYPPGTLLRLANRELAVATRVHGNGEQPGHAAIFLDYRGRVLNAPRAWNPVSAPHAIAGLMEMEPAWTELRWESYWGY